MDLPELPSKRKHDEADFGLELRKIIEEKKIEFKVTTFLETKDSRGKDRIAFSEITEKQRHANIRCSTSTGFLIRTTVATPGTADFIYGVNSPAYIIIAYPEVFCFIPIQVLIDEDKASKVRSLYVDRAIEIAEYVFKR